MNNNLVAEKRPDKNGNVVTRWIRSFTARDTAKSIPAPTAPSVRALRPAPMTEQRKRQYMDLARTLRANAEFGNINNIAPSLEMIAKYDPDLLDRIEESIHATDSQIDFWTGEMTSQVGLNEEFPEQIKSMLDRHHAAFVINPLIKRIADNGGNITSNLMTASTIGDVVSAITSRKVEDNFDETIAAVTMIVYIKRLHVGGLLAADYATYPRLLEDAKYIATRVDEVERILPELYERKAYDRETIDMLLDAPSPSLMEGLL